MASKKDNPTPLFCVRVKDKISGRMVYFNFKAMDIVAEPRVEIVENGIIQMSFMQNPKLEEDYKIPLLTSPMFWSKDTNKKHDSDASERDYVIDVGLNDRFALSKVATSEIIRHYVLSVGLSVVQDKFNDAAQSPFDKSKQNLGHKLDLDHANYKILDKKLMVDRTDELVRNKIVVVRGDDGSSSSDACDDHADKSISKSSEDSESIQYDLHLRPALKILTCSISTEKLPRSFGFNDDRIRVELDDGRVLDVYIPTVIDLTQAAKYKFDDKLCLFRIVFKIKE